MPDASNFTSKGTAPIPFAGVTTRFTSSAEEAGVEDKVLSESSPLQLLLAVVMVQDWEIDLFKAVLELALVTPGVFS